MRPAHADIDFMYGSMHNREDVDPGTLTKPMEVGRATRLRLPDGWGRTEFAKLAEESAPELERIKKGFRVEYGEGMLRGQLSCDAQAALATIQLRASSVQKLPTAPSVTPLTECA